MEPSDRTEPELLDDLRPTVDAGEDDDELFDVQIWAEAHLAEVDAQAEHHSRFPGLPFH